MAAKESFSSLEIIIFSFVSSSSSNSVCEISIHARTALEGEGGGGDSLIKVGMDVQRVQNLGRAKFLLKT